MPSLADYSLDELAALFTGWGHLPVHAKRLLRAYYDQSGQIDLAAVPIAHRLRDRIGAELPLHTTRIASRSASADGTVKLLLACTDGAQVESVLMPDYRPDRSAGCLSTQAGCAMACDFCATGAQGFTRNLTTGEIIEQFLALKSESVALGRILRTVVLMGMGEPLLNLANVTKAIRLLAGDHTAHLGWRQITLSTVGLLPQLQHFVGLRLNVQLALSLHAPDDTLRAQLVPPARRFAIADLLDLAQRHQENTGRITVIQYCLLDGVNDSPAQALALAQLLAGRRMHVNLLTYNPTGRPYRPSPEEAIDVFLGTLRNNRIVAHLRRSRGQDIAAACGQLRTLHPTGSKPLNK